MDISIIESTNADNTDTITILDESILIIVLCVEAISLYIDPPVDIFITIGRTYKIVNRNDITPNLRITYLDDIIKCLCNSEI